MIKYKGEDIMKINEISYDEKKYLFKIVLEDKSQLNISYETYEKHQLVKGLEIEDKILNQLIEEDEFLACKSAALSLINYKMRSSKELRDRLFIKGYSKKQVDKTLNYLKEKSFLNDQYYANEYFKQLLHMKNFSLNKIKQKMYEKGIDKELIMDIQDHEYSELIEKKNCLYHAEKKSRSLDLDDRKSYDKAFRYLVSNGFSFEMSKNTLNELKKND